MRSKPPADLVKRLDPRTKPLVLSWWQNLSPDARRSLRAPARARGVVARFIDDDFRDDAEVDDFYEHLINHEVTLDDGRTFHVCSAHLEARALLRRGRIPGAFRCPRADAACPMRRLVEEGGGRAVRLELAREGE